MRANLNAGVDCDDNRRQIQAAGASYAALSFWPFASHATESTNPAQPLRSSRKETHP